MIVRVYDEPLRDGRARLLVDRIWPRGISKQELGHDAWIKGVAPSDALRKWFGHEPDRWDEFRNRYLHELSRNDAYVEECLEWCRKGAVTLLYAAKDRNQNQAVVLQEYLTHRLMEEPK